MRDECPDYDTRYGEGPMETYDPWPPGSDILDADPGDFGCDSCAMDGPYDIHRPMCQYVQPGYIRYMEELADRHENGSKCPRCLERGVTSRMRERKTYTRQYGGGYDTYEWCEAEGCGHAEVYV